jgi:hypothetical protein
MDISPPSDVPIVLASDVQGGDPVVAGLHGQLVLTYEDKTGNRTAMAFAPATGWTSMGTPTTGQTDGSNVAVLGDGTVLVVWYGRNDCLPYYSHAPPGAGWGPVVKIMAGMGCGSTPDPQLLSDRTADAVAAWPQDVTALSEVQSYGQGAWTTPQTKRMLYGMAMGNGALMALDDTGAQYGSAGVLQEVGLPANACGFANAVLHMDASGRAVLGWGCSGLLNMISVYYSRFVPGSGWTPQTRIDGPGGSTNGTGELWGLAVNDSGEAVALWGTNDFIASLSELALWVSVLP